MGRCPVAAMFNNRFLHALLTMLLLTGSVLAQNSTTRGPYTVHYNALPTTLLSPDVARNSGITRSASRGLLNIAVLRDADGTQVATIARVDAAATNPAGQRQSLRMREVREGEAIYYLGEPRISSTDEQLDFEVTVTPAGSAEPIVIRFTQSFHP
jgi:hypothetical protein